MTKAARKARIRSISSISKKMPAKRNSSIADAAQKGVRGGTLAADWSLFARNRREFAMKKMMKKLPIVGVALCFSLSFALAQGSSTVGMGPRQSAATGGAFGTSPLAPGTNSAGTALSAGGSSGATKGPPLGTGDPIVDREDKEVARKVQSICRGC